jgi:hypothetical protein
MRGAVTTRTDSTSPISPASINDRASTCGETPGVEHALRIV